MSLTTQRSASISGARYPELKSGMNGALFKGSRAVLSIIQTDGHISSDYSWLSCQVFCCGKFQQQIRGQFESIDKANKLLALFLSNPILSYPILSKEHGDLRNEVVNGQKFSKIKDYAFNK